MTRRSAPAGSPARPMPRAIVHPERGVTIAVDVGPRSTARARA